MANAPSPIVEAWVECDQVRMVCAVSPFVAGDTRELMRVTLIDESGNVGIGEACPWPTLHAMDIEDVARALRAGVEALTTGPQNILDFAGLRALAHDVERANPTPFVAWTLFSALLELTAARQGTTVARVLGSEASRVRTAALVVRDEPLAPLATLLSLSHTVKVKIANVDDDARVREVHALAPRAALRLDANRALSKNGALALAARLRDLPIAFFEEPVGARDEAAFVDAGHSIALDESLHTLSAEALSVDALIERRPRALVVKPSVLGPVRTMELVARARDSARTPPILISSAFETRRARAVLAALHASVSPDACAGLGTGRFIDEPALEDREGFISLTLGARRA